MRITSITPVSYNQNNQRISTMNKPKTFGQGWHFGEVITPNEVTKSLQDIANRIENEKLKFEFEYSLKKGVRETLKLNNDLVTFFTCPTKKFVSAFLTYAVDNNNITSMDIFGLNGHYKFTPEGMDTETKKIYDEIADYIQGALKYVKESKWFL